MRNRLFRRESAWPSFFIYAALAVVMTLPLATTLGSRIPGDGGDSFVHLWTFDWVKQALFEGETLFFTDMLFYPEGASLVLHNIAWLDIAVWLPLQAVLGEATAYTLLYLLIFAFNGYGTYRLGWHLTRSRAGAFVAGLIVAFWPYTLSHHDHPNLILIGWVPLTLVYLDRLLRRGRWQDAVWTGLLLALVVISRWQMVVIGGMLIGIYLVHSLIVNRQIRLSRALGLLSLSLVIAAVLIAPLLSPLVSQVAQGDGALLTVYEELGHTDLSAYFIPSRYHPLWGDAVEPLYDNFEVNHYFAPFVGYAVLLLALYGAVRAWPRSRVWVIAAAAYVLLALGPHLTVYGRTFDLPMPYELVQDTFFMQIIRRPDRLNVMLSIPVAILAAFGLVALRQRRSLPQPAWRLVVAIVALLIMFEYVVDFWTLPLSVPAWYRDLAATPGEFAIANFPMTPRGPADKWNMYYQMTHGKPLVEGHVSRPLPAALAFIESVPLLAERGTTGDAVPDQANVTEQLRLLEEANVRYLVLNKRWHDVARLEAWRDWIVMPPEYEDGDVLVYRTHVDPARDLRWESFLLEDGEQEIGLLHSSVAPDAVGQGSWLDVAATWGSGADVARDYDVCIGLRARGGDAARLDCQPIAASWPSSRWQAGEIVHSAYTVPVDPFLASGTYTVTLSLSPAEDPGTVGRPATVGTIALDTVARVYAAPEPKTPATAVWNDEIRLLGYDMEPPAADQLSLTLHWEALQRMAQSYKVYVHVIDPASGSLVAQADAVPRNWGYPTIWWDAGEFVSDTMVVDLAGVPPGDYDLFVGLYDEVTGIRQTLSAADPDQAGADSFRLGKMTLDDD